MARMVTDEKSVTIRLIRVFRVQSFCFNPCAAFHLCEKIHYFLFNSNNASLRIVSIPVVALSSDTVQIFPSRK